MAKKVTIDDLAVMVNKGFDGVNRRFAEMATKEDIKELKAELRTEMHDGFKRVHKDIEELDFKIGSATSSWNKDFERIHSWVMELDERLTKVEAKSGKIK